MDLQYISTRYTSIEAVNADIDLARKIRGEIYLTQQASKERLRFWTLINHRKDFLIRETRLIVHTEEWQTIASRALLDANRQLDEIDTCIMALTAMKSKLEEMFAEAAQKSE